MLQPVCTLCSNLYQQKICMILLRSLVVSMPGAFVELSESCHGSNPGGSVFGVPDEIS